MLQMTLFLSSITRGLAQRANADTRPYFAAQSFLAAPPQAAENGQGHDQCRNKFCNQFCHRAIVAGVPVGLLALGPYKDIALKMVAG